MIDRSFTLPGSPEKGVLLIHGMTGAPGEMKYLAKKLNRAGYSVCAPQLAGHGADQTTLLKSSWRDWLGSLHDEYKRFSTTVDNVFVAGVCVGGALGLQLAALEPSIRAAAVYSMTFEYDGWNMDAWHKTASLLQFVVGLPGLRSISIKESYPFGLKDERLRAIAHLAPDGLIDGAHPAAPFGSLRQMYRLGRDIKRIAPTLKVPTLIIHARDDDFSHKRNSYKLAQALGGPVSLHILDDSYHMIHVDQQRNLVAALTADFFKSYAVQSGIKEAQVAYA